jgi:hypothetical protein
MELGFYMGDDLNDANDNLWFTLLFKRTEILALPDSEFRDLVEIFINGIMRNREFSSWQIKIINELAAKDRIQHPAVWLKERARTLSSIKPVAHQIGRWGWKEPNTHIVIDRLLKVIPNVKYVHVVRNGLDMAYSANQNQLQLWGPRFIGKECEVSPYYSLRYWCVAHKRILTLGESMGPHFLFLNFDHLCQNPGDGVIKLLEFLKMDIPNSQVNSLVDLVKPPASIGRFRQHDIDAFAPEDITFLKQLGFDTRVE